MEAGPSITDLITPGVVAVVRGNLTKFPHVVEGIADQVVSPGASFDEKITAMKAVRNALLDLLDPVDGV